MGKIKQLQKEWNKWNKSWNSREEYDEFIKKYPKSDLYGLTLEKYTNIKTDKNIEYFTHWLERKTEHCGKFRTASSYSYGIYKVNVNNIKDEKEKLKATDKYKAYDENNKKSKEYLDYEKAQNFFEKRIKPIIIALVNYEDIGEKNNIKTIRPLDINYTRKIAYMYNIDKLIPIFKKEVLESIAEFFDIENEIDFSSYKATEPILEKIKEVFEINDMIDIELSQKIATFLWEKFGKSVSFESKNIIYYGAPGTGKTYTIQNAVEQRVLLENAKSCFTQFHPSYSYEDFIDGIKPIGIDKIGNIKFKLIDGHFKKLCRDAAKELKENTKDLKKFYFIADEINRAELSRVLGEVLVCLEEDKRLKYNSKENKWEGLKLKTKNSDLWKEENAVIVENGEYYFGIPENVYFIGTMNDIDKSIDSFDLALRRRFKWIYKGFDRNVVIDKLIEKNANEKTIEEYIKKCENLNKYISDTLEFGKSYELGHSYFMNINIRNGEISKAAYENLFEQELKLLLVEYLRAEYDEKEINNKLKEMRKKFIGNDSD